eukprot:jgi/Chlat1/4149/Chrsp27S04259
MMIGPKGLAHGECWGECWGVRVVAQRRRSSRQQRKQQQQEEEDDNDDDNDDNNNMSHAHTTHNKHASPLLEPLLHPPALAPPDITAVPAPTPPPLLAISTTKPTPNDKPTPTPSSPLTLSLWLLAVVSLGAANRVSFKLMQYSSLNYSYFDAQFTTLAYVPVSFFVVWVKLRFFPTHITQEQRAFPKRRFALMGLMDCLQGLLINGNVPTRRRSVDVYAHVHTTSAFVHICIET